jgi:PP-loop superfamily ATP-utilizing enzyme
MYQTSPKKIDHQRKVTSNQQCKDELKYELPILFDCFKSAVNAFEKEIRQTPPDARVRNLEATLLNSKMIQSVREKFSDSCYFGKYKRFILRINGYIVLFKKLDKNGLPMNIKTKASNAISNQLTLPLFEEDSAEFEPILFFGYQKNEVGEIFNPRLTYIKDDKIKWVINEQHIETKDTTDSSISVVEKERETISPKIKPGVKKKKASNE